MTRRRVILAMAAGGLAALLLAGCSAESRERLLPYVFDGVIQKEPPPTRRVRRDLLQEIEQLKQDLADARAAAARKDKHEEEEESPVEEADTWEEAAKFLPKDAAGHVDWVEAVKAGAIRPRPGPDPKTPEQAILDMDVELASAPSRLFSVTYPHAAHTRWLACQNCHPAIFPLSRQAAPTAVTMAKILAGQYCGVCHGKVAFGIEGRCARCHRKVPATADWRPAAEPQKPIERAARWEEAAKLLAAGGSDWAKALAEGVIAPRPGIDPKAEDEAVFPLEVELTPADNPAFKVVFPHETHTTLLTCANCHPGIFQMAGGADPITMDKIYAGEYCGRCHGKVAFDVATGCPRCHPALRGG